MYYVLEPDNDPVVWGNLTGDVEDVDWYQGAKFSALDAPLCVDIHTETKRFPDFFEVADAPIVSDKFLALLGDCGVDNFDAYSVTLDAHVEREYFALNTLGWLCVMDLEASVFTPDTEEDPDALIVESIEHLCIHEAKIDGVKLFRLFEYPMVLIVNGILAEAMRAMSGVRLTPVAQWSCR